MTVIHKEGDTWYRYSDRLHGSANEYDEIVWTDVYLSLEEHTVCKVTPKGVWVTDGLDRKFILLTANKQFAAPTKEEALNSLLARKKRQIRILESQLKHARRASVVALEELSKLAAANNQLAA